MLCRASCEPGHHCQESPTAALGREVGLGAHPELSSELLAPCRHWEYITSPGGGGLLSIFSRTLLALSSSPVSTQCFQQLQKYKNQRSCRCGEEIQVSVPTFSGAAPQAGYPPWWGSGCWCLLSPVSPQCLPFPPCFLLWFVFFF